MSAGGPAVRPLRARLRAAIRRGAVLRGSAAGAVAAPPLPARVRAAAAARAWAAGPQARLGVVRIALFAIWLVVVVPDPLGYLADLPRAVGVGVFRWLPDADPAWLGPFKAVLVVTLVACLAGAPGFRAWVVAAAALLTVHQALLREYTFVNHEELAPLVCTWVLAVFGEPGAFAARPVRARAPATALWALTAALLLPYALIAAHRLAFAAPDVFTGDSLAYWLASLDSLDRDGWSVGLWALGHPALVVALKAGFLVTTVIELLAPLCLVAPRLARAWAVAVVGFHVTNELTLNLFFWQNAILVALLVGWSAAPPRARRAGGS